MDDLNKYYNLLFKKAYKLESIHFWLGIILIGILVSSNFLNGYLLYAITIVGLLTQVGSFIIKYRQKQNEMIAHKLQEYAMLYTTFRKSTFNFDISQIKGTIANEIHKKVTEQENPPESSDYLIDETSKNALLLMIQENAFWNYHLFTASFWNAIQFFIIPITGIVLFILFALVGNTSWVDAEYFGPRILIAVLAANIFFNQIDEILKWHNGAKGMLELDNMIARDGDKGDDFWLHIFAKYNILKTSTPLVSNRLYSQNREKLNSAWKTRFLFLYGDKSKTKS